MISFLKMGDFLRMILKEIYVVRTPSLVVDFWVGNAKNASRTWNSSDVSMLLWSQGDPGNTAVKFVEICLLVG